MTTDRESVSDNGTVTLPPAGGDGAGAVSGGSYDIVAPLDGHEDQRWESEHWRELYRGVARRIVTALQPRTVHHVGCGHGLLVQALVEVGVDATGSDNSSQAIASAHPDVRDRLRAANAVEPLPGTYDLVVCGAVLALLPVAESRKAIDALTAAADRILVSSTPADFEKGAHVDVQPIAPWASSFAERGFFLRGSDLDGAFLTSWSLMFERGEPSRTAIVREYEARLSPLLLELSAQRQALHEASQELDGLRTRLAEVDGRPRVVQADDAAILAVHADLTARDHLIGVEATVQRQERLIDRLRDRNRELRRQLRDAEDRSSVRRRLARKGRALLDGDRA
ncbi:class I SAM-dependent methyltransferase [Nocardioides carbamazepini]|uniref:class I SAM-dependent methyltransferase n=1 Tax=Nocardioides carbamazepini TaxID=2854259 RepID=UPI00214A81A7|nr:class I SAM-dependent methyltransferase [Nocardioides carbamazepini]MCR1782667.1 class I SAM-dependent methyltransferase [Nocardioides carbamazepini]